MRLKSNSIQQATVPWFLGSEMQQRLITTIAIFASLTIHAMVLGLSVSMSVRSMAGYSGSKDVNVVFYQGPLQEDLPIKDRSLRHMRTKKVKAKRHIDRVSPFRITNPKDKTIKAQPVVNKGTFKEVSREIAELKDPPRNQQDRPLPEPGHNNAQEVVAHRGVPSSGKGLLYRGGFGTLNGPKFLKKVIPEYPPLARKLGKQAVVVLKLYIDRWGNLKRAEVLNDPGYGFAESALEAIKRSRFMPAVQAGVPVDSEVLLRVRFKLKDS